MKKIFFVLLLIIISVVGINIGFGSADALKEEKSVIGINNNTPSTTAEEKPEKAVEPGIPLTLSIPSINVETDIESVAKDQRGAMDVPKNADNVAWYNLGARPGNAGNAVLAGHFDKVTGAPAVFFDLKRLDIGDEVVITDSQGQDFTFSVVRKAQYPDADFPLQEVFGSSDKKMLNLITCTGSFNSATKLYSHRTVIYTELVE